MSNRIRFNANHQKILEAVIYIAQEQPGIDLYAILKVLYYAEKGHLNKYGRPITGDFMRALELGPVPQLAYDIVNESDFDMVDPSVMVAFKKRVKVGNSKRGDKSYKAKDAPNLYGFTQTDIECLDDAIEKYGSLSFEELKKISHLELGWLETERSGTIDYALMIDAETEHRDQVIAELSEMAPYLEF